MLSPSLFLHSGKPLLYWLLPVSLKGTACMNQGWTTLQSYEFPAITLWPDCPERPEMHLRISFHSSIFFHWCKGAVSAARVLAMLAYNADLGLLMAWEAHSCQIVSHIHWKDISACNLLVLFLNKTKLPAKAQRVAKSVKLRPPPQPRCFSLKL